MKKNLLPLLLLSAAGLLYACMQDKDGMAAAKRTVESRLTVDEARAFFEKNTARTRSEQPCEEQLPFVMGHVSPNWDEAKASASARLSSVDVPTEGEYAYCVVRERPDGTAYGVPASSKIIIVKSPQTDSMATYIRVCIPDEEYAAWYDGNISDMTLNCEDRGDYSGLEYYATLDGYPVAVARYTDGKCTGSVYLFDETISPEETARRYAVLFRNMWIFRNPATGSKTRTGAEDEWRYGAPGSIFIDSRGGIYIYVDIDGDGKSDAITQFMPIGAGGGHTDGPGIGGGAGGGSSSDDNTGNNDSGKTDPVNPTNPGGSSNTGNKDNGKQDTPTDIYGNPVDPKNPNLPKKDMPPLNPLLNHLDPLPLPPLRPEEPESPQQPEEKKPCFDIEKIQANPLIEMAILGTKNNGIKGGRYGRGRGRMHRGIDLNAPVGTPVYALFDGVVTMIINKYDPNVPYDDYPQTYPSDTKQNYNAGNRIWIECQTSKGKILIKYFHLNDVSIKLGSIKAGSLIGHTGKTGSACCSQSAGPHLHMETYINGMLTNPEEFLYTHFDEQGNSITTDCNK